MNNKIKSIKEISKISSDSRENGKKIIFCHGIFDIIHLGHVHLLSKSKSKGDILIVGVDHDLNAKAIKGPTRPINDHRSRMLVVASLEPVDYVFLIPPFVGKNVDNFFIKLYKTINPYAITSSLKAGINGVYKQRRAMELGIKFIDISDYIHNKNTTRIAKIFGIE